MKKIYLIPNLIFLALLFNSCGGGGDASFDTGNTKIAIVTCNNITPTYTDIQEGDLLVKESDSTIVTIVHNTNSSKKICITTGSAHLLRNN